MPTPAKKKTYTQQPSKLLTAADYPALMMQHLALHDKSIINNTIRLVDKPKENKRFRITTFMGRTIQTQNELLYPPSTLKVPPHIQEQRDIKAAGGKCDISWLWKLIKDDKGLFSSMLVSRDTATEHTFTIYKLVGGREYKRVEWKCDLPNSEIAIYPTEAGIHYLNDDIINTPAMGIINPVNSIGVAGAGFARRMKEVFVEYMGVYQEECNRKRLSVGKVLYIPIAGKLIICMPLMHHYTEGATIDAIIQGFEAFLRTYRSKNITSLSLPLLGCDLSDLNIQTVKDVTERYLGNLGIPVYVHENYGTKSDHVRVLPINIHTDLAPPAPVTSSTSVLSTTEPLNKALEDDIEAILNGSGSQNNTTTTSDIPHPEGLSDDVPF